LEKIKWGSGQVCFEIRSPDAEAVEEARRVFSRWPPPEDAQVQAYWEIRRSDGGFVVHPPPVAPPGTTVPSRLDAGSAVTVVEYAAIWHIVEHCPHVLAFHSALLCREGKAVAIVGPSEAGKSTLSTALWKSGWTFLCDDTTMVCGTTAAPAPRRVSLRETSRPLVGDELWDEIKSSTGYRPTSVGCLFHPAQGDLIEREVDLSAVIFLKRNGAPKDTTGPTPLTGAEAALSLLPYTNLVRTLPFSEALAPIATLMSQVPAWDLPRAPLPDMIESVERLCGLTELASA
jgi:hypothetical protein